MTALDAAPRRAVIPALPLTGAALLLFGIAAVGGVLLRPALPIDETRYLAVAWEMRLSGNWLVPHLNGEVYSHKPPLLFWLINLVWAVTGPSEIAARLVGPAFGLAAIAATARLAARLAPGDAEAGGRAALVLASFAGFALYAGLTMFDAMLTLAAVLGVLSLTRIGDAGPGWRPWAGFGAAVALGVLAKGPAILLHLVPVALATPFWAGIGWGRMARGLGLGLGAAMGLVGLWLGPALALGGPDYRHAVLWTQSAGRMVDSFAHRQPWWFFPTVLPFLTWPWSWSPRVWQGLRRSGPAPVWAGATLLSFSLISGKQAHYLLPMLPALAILFAPALDDRRLRAPVAAVLPAALALLLLALAAGTVPGDLGEIAAPGPLMALAGGLMAGIAVLAWRGGSLRLALLSPATMLVLGLLFLGRPGDIYDTHRIADWLRPHDASGIGLLGRGYAGQFTFAGRLRHPVATLPDPEAALRWLAERPDRILLARLDESHPASAPARAFVFRNVPYGLWTATAASRPPVHPPHRSP